MTQTITRRGADEMGRHRPEASTDRDNRAAEFSADRIAAKTISCRAYEQLMAGETVSWAQILREHPMLGQITVTELVNAGVVEVTPDYDPGTEQIDFRLRRREAEDIGFERDLPTRQQWGLIVAPGEHASFAGNLRQTGRPELRVVRRA